MVKYTKLSKILAIVVALVIAAAAVVFFVFGAEKGGAGYNGGFEAVYTSTSEDTSAIAKAVRAEIGITPAVKVAYKAEGGINGTVKLVFDGVSLSDDQLAKVDAAMASVDASAARKTAGEIKTLKDGKIDIWNIVIAIAVVAALSFLYCIFRFKKIFGVKPAALAAVTSVAAPAFALALMLIFRLSLSSFAEYIFIAVSIASAVIAFICFEVIVDNKAAGTAKPFSSDVVNGAISTVSNLLVFPAEIICIALVAVFAVTLIMGFALAAATVIEIIFAIAATVILPVYVIAPLMAKD